MKQIFINIPVEDLAKSKSFYSELGFTNYPLFSSENQICMLWGDHILLMLQSKTFFSSGNNKTIADVKTSLTASFTLPVESINQVNEIVERGLNAGGREILPMQDLSFMQVRTIEDIDGHIWGIIHLDKEKFEAFKRD
jgi:predicted lactoylglutathione lyase